MHTKENEDIEIHFSRPDLHQDEIQAIMADLHKQIEEIGNFPDRSLFFQNPKIFDGWLNLIRTIRKIEVWEKPDDNTEWGDRTETYVAYLLDMRALYADYINLVKSYYYELRKLIDDYNKLRVGDCIGADTLEALFAEYDPIELNDFNLYLPTINSNSHNARNSMFMTLTEIFHILSTLMDIGLKIFTDLNPSYEDFTLAINNDLRGWHFTFGKSMFKNMKEELNRHYKQHPTDHNTPELWGEMLRADEDALKLAMKQQLTTCEDAKQEHWGEGMIKQMDENGELMRLIYSSCYTEELFDIDKVENLKKFIELLTPDALSMFYDIIVRRALIQCEMFPELKVQYGEWLNRDIKRAIELEETGMSTVRQSKLDDIIKILQKGNWKAPATAENITQLLNAVFGRDFSLLEDDDELLCEKMWAYVDGVRGDNMKVVPANLAGFFKEENLLNGSPKNISDDLFGKTNNQSNNINKGKSNYCSNTFAEVIPFLRKYTSKIIRQA